MVVILPAVQGVRARIAEHVVIIIMAVQAVIALGTVKIIRAVIALQLVVIPSAVQGVVPRCAEKVVVAQTSLYQVGAGVTADLVIAAPADNDVAEARGVRLWRGVVVLCRGDGGIEIGNRTYRHQPHEARQPQHMCPLRIHMHDTRACKGDTCKLCIAANQRADVG